MKWIKRVLLLIALALSLVVVVAVVGIYLYRGTPRWYRRQIATTQQVRDAANRADQELLDLFSWAASARAQQLRRLHGKSKPGESPIRPKTITLDEDEINSFASSWKNPDEIALEGRISRYFTDGRAVFQDGAFILVGQSPALGTLASARFLIRIDEEGKLHVDLDSLRAGLLPIPQSALSDHLNRLRALLQEQLASERQSANVDAVDTANGAALGASWLRLLICSMTGQATEPLLIIPFSMSNFHQGFPVKVTAIAITEGRITLTLEPLGAADHDALAKMLKQPLGESN